MKDENSPPVSPVTVKEDHPPYHQLTNGHFESPEKSIESPVPPGDGWDDVIVVEEAPAAKESQLVKDNAPSSDDIPLDVVLAQGFEKQTLF